MQCSQCEAQNDADVRFCESCGATLARLCPGCGHALKPQARFCGDCGAAVGGRGSRRASDGVEEGSAGASPSKPTIVEGIRDRENVVLMSFPDEAAFSEWSQSPAYQQISKDRLAGADSMALLVKGF